MIYALSNHNSKYYKIQTTSHVYYPSKNIYVHFLSYLTRIWGWLTVENDIHSNRIYIVFQRADLFIHLFLRIYSPTVFHVLFCKINDKKQHEYGFSVDKHMTTEGR